MQQATLSPPLPELAFLEKPYQSDPFVALADLFNEVSLFELRQKIMYVFEAAALEGEPHELLVTGNIHSPFAFYREIQCLLEAAYLIDKLKRQGNITIEYANIAA